jgi:hypothetical protein
MVIKRTFIFSNKPDEKTKQSTIKDLIRKCIVDLDFDINSTYELKINFDINELSKHFRIEVLLIKDNMPETIDIVKKFKNIMFVEDNKND